MLSEKGLCYSLHFLDWSFADSQMRRKGSAEKVSSLLTTTMNLKMGFA